MIAVVVAAAGDFPSTDAAGIAVLFGLTYVIERGINEFYKTFLREEDQSKYSIPMQLSVRGKVVTERRTRLLAGLAYVVGVLAVVLVIDAIGDQGAGGLAVVLVVGSLGGWISAFGGAWKDAPVEGFQPFKFVRSPLVALGYALLLAALTTDPCTPRSARSATPSPRSRPTRRSSSRTRHAGSSPGRRSSVPSGSNGGTASCRSTWRSGSASSSCSWSRSPSHTRG